MGTIGTSPPRIDGKDKVTGKALYIDDLVFPEMLFGLTIRTTIPHGKIQKIFFDPDFDWSGIVTVTSKDIPGKNVIALIENDQPCLVDQITQHVDEPIVLLACSDRIHLLEASRHVHIDYEPLPYILDPLDAVKANDLLKRLGIKRGNVAKGFEESELIIEGMYRTGSQEHMYIEPCGMIAMPEEDGIKVLGSMQCPYYVHKALKVLMNLPDEKVRVIQTVTGGGFGGKEEYPSMLAGHAALLAWKVGKPVKMVYDRKEDIAATTKRHPSIVRHKTGLKKDGTIMAMEIELVMDGGAYVTLSPVVLSRGIIHATGPYRCANVKIVGLAAKTNTPPNGAFRGFGAPQTTFAYERQMDRCAKAVGLSPLEFRRRNMYRPGDVTATGQTLLDVQTQSVFDEIQKLPRHEPATNFSRKVKGRGYSFYWHGAGFTGDGEQRLKSRVGAELLPGGKVRILAASTDIGQGTNTIFVQIAAETLGLSMDQVLLEAPDTRLVPDSGPTVASRTAMVVGRLVEECCRKILKTLSPLPGDFKTRAETYLSKNKTLKVLKEFSNPSSATWDSVTYEGDAYAAYSWAANVADVEVDLDTFDVRIERLWTIAEVGKALHKVLAEGQIEGGVIQAVGWALLENVVYKDGKVRNDRMTDCLIPTAVDSPPTETIILEQPYLHGPFGAKGIGELPMDGPAPAIAAAIEAATGIPINEIPATPERLLRWNLNQRDQIFTKTIER